MDSPFEVSRLNALQAAVWPAAMAGDLQALIVAARIIDARCRLLGLIGPATKRVGAEPAGEVGASLGQQQCRGVRAAWFAQVEQQGQCDPLVQQLGGELRQHG